MDKKAGYIILRQEKVAVVSVTFAELCLIQLVKVPGGGLVAKKKLIWYLFVLTTIHGIYATFTNSLLKER